LLEIKWYTPVSSLCYDVHILGGHIHSTRKNTEASVIATKEIGLEGNAEKSKHMVMPQDQYADKVATYRQVINPLKQWNSLNIW
jgi:hypothetical protein